MRTISHWNNLPREVEGYPTVDTSNSVGSGESSCPDCASAKERLDQIIHEVPSNLVLYDPVIISAESVWILKK